MLLGGMPLFWKSSLMSCICVSSLEAEYQSLSLSLRQVIAFKLLIDEIVLTFKMEKLRATITCTVFEERDSTVTPILI